MYRTHNNGILRIENVGEVVTLSGWLSKKRNLGGLLFADLRDRHGITQVVCRPETPSYSVLEEARNEYVLKVVGKVIKRESVNKNLPTGEIEVEASEIEILSEAELPPMIIADETDALEDLRMKYRYLDLRRPVMQKNLILRHNITKAIRNYLDGLDFVDVETPIFGKSTPEGARDYLVPSRVHPGKFYALPQSPQIYKQLLMVSGLERYYQIARCFRDEDLRADRQMEFTQVDIEMSFVDEPDIFAVMEGLLKKVLKDTRNIDIPTPFVHITFDESMERFGNDKPDLRFGLELATITEEAKKVDFMVFQNAINEGGVVKGFNAKGASSKYSRKEIDRLTEGVKKLKAKGLMWLKYDNNQFAGSIAKALTEDFSKYLIEKFNVENGDLLFFVADSYNVANASLSWLRNTMGKELGLCDPINLNLHGLLTGHHLNIVKKKEDTLLLIIHLLLQKISVKECF